MDSVVNKPNGGTVVNPAAQATTAKEQTEKENMQEYEYKRSVTIKATESYSAYRQANINVLGRRTSSIGSSMSSTNILCANDKELAVIFPSLIGLSANNQDFHKRVKDYLSNIQVAVTDKVTFDSSLRFYHKSDYEKFKAEEDRINNVYDNTDKSEIKDLKSAITKKCEAINALESRYIGDGLCVPVNAAAYILYRHSLFYRPIAKELSLAGGDATIRFYLVDEQKEKNKQAKMLQSRKAASKNFLDICGNDDKFNAIFVRYCTDNHFNLVDYMSKDREEKELIIDEFSRSNPAKFNSFCNDSNLLITAFIERLIARGELIKSEFNQQISLPDGTFVGKNMIDAIAYFNNPANKSLKESLESKLKIFSY